jgi:hypothetical protein
MTDFHSGGLKKDLPIYRDNAYFHLNIKALNGGLTSTISGIYQRENLLVFQNF